jgi:hypothetical protein
MGQRLREPNAVLAWAATSPVSIFSLDGGRTLSGTNTDQDTGLPVVNAEVSLELVGGPPMHFTASREKVKMNNRNYNG